MGLVLDSSALIAAERGKLPVSELLASLGSEYSETEFLPYSITVMELEHGWHRANTPEAASKRRRYLDEVFAVVPGEPFTREMGVLAAKIDADMKKMGLVIATADLLIGVTALHYGYGIGTSNVRHFQNDPRAPMSALYETRSAYGMENARPTAIAVAVSQGWIDGCNPILLCEPTGDLRGIA